MKRMRSQYHLQSLGYALGSGRRQALLTDIPWSGKRCATSNMASAILGSRRTTTEIETLTDSPMPKDLPNACTHFSCHIRRGFVNSMWAGCIFALSTRIAKCLHVQLHATHSKAHRCPLLAHCHVELLQLICQAPPTEQGAKSKAQVWAG